MTLKGICWALTRYGGATLKTAKQIIDEVAGNDNPNPSAKPKSALDQAFATPNRNFLEPAQYVDNGVVKPIEAKNQ